MRLRMISLLLHRECCVCEVMQVLDISQTRASRNLSMLHKVGFLKLRKEGLWAYYSIDKSSLDASLSSLLAAVEMGFSASPVARRDKKRLQQCQRLGPQSCQKPPCKSKQVTGTLPYGGNEPQ
jgi:ArsR family transcriptional regulator, arsenate/arsenite/antimonite-responsive transcriptional repressor